MTFTQSITTCMNNYAVFTSRASRSEFWWFFLFLSLLGFLGILQDPSFLDTESIDAESAYYDPVSTAIFLVFLLPYLAVGARRLHDIGKSGWWQLLSLPFYVPASFVDAIALTETTSEILLILALAGSIALLVLFALPTNPAGDKYNLEETPSPQ